MKKNYYAVKYNFSIENVDSSAQEGAEVLDFLILSWFSAPLQLLLRVSIKRIQKPVM